MTKQEHELLRAIMAELEKRGNDYDRASDTKHEITRAIYRSKASAMAEAAYVVLRVIELGRLPDSDEW